MLLLSPALLQPFLLQDSVQLLENRVRAGSLPWDASWVWG